MLQILLNVQIKANLKHQYIVMIRILKQNRTWQKMLNKLNIGNKNDISKQNKVCMQYVYQMRKGNKQQTKTAKRQIIEIVPVSLDLHSQNSSSILPLDTPYQQHVIPQQTTSSPQLQLNLIKINPKTVSTKEEDIPSPDYNPPKDRKSSHKRNKKKPKNQYLEEKKETDVTSHQSIIEVSPINNKPIILQQKTQKTQHYSYHGGNQEQSDQSGQEYQAPPQFQISQVKKANIQVPKTFVADSFDDLIFSQIPPHCTVSTIVHFNHQFLSMKRQYNLYLINQKKYLFSAKKNRMKFTSQFQFFGKNSNGQSPIGYLKSNFTGLQFVLNKVLKNENNRKSELCWIGYDLNLLGLSNQRNITVLKNTNAKLEKIPYFSQIKNYYENGITSKFQKFSTRKATLNKFGEYQLDFNGKVSIPSVANFILTDSKDKGCILFGKRKQNAFILQISYPFSIFQGFAIAISNLDNKLFVR